MPGPLVGFGTDIDTDALYRRIVQLERFSQDPLNVNIGGGVAGGVQIASLPRVANAYATPWRGKPVANEALWMDSIWTNVYGLNSRKRYIANRATSSVRLVYAHTTQTPDTLPNAPLTVRASVEPSNGATRVPVTFNGKRDGEVSPGGFIVSDPVSASLIAGQQFWVWTYASSPNQPFCGMPLTVPAWGEGCDATSNTAVADKTLSGSITANGVGHYSPIAVIGDAGINLPFVGHFGDSIGAGLGDGANLDVGHGFLRQAMGNTIPFISLCISGDYYSNSHTFRYPFYQGCTDVIDEMGTNDIRTGQSQATVQTNMIAAWSTFAAFGARVWRTTLTPVSSSTDNWATVANQTTGANNATRVTINNWIRDGAPLASASNLVAVATGTAGALRAGSPGHPLSGYFETADTVESSRDSGKWAVGMVYLTDAAGLHPSTAGHAAMAAAINTTRFTA